QTCDAERPRQTQDAEAGSEALCRMRPLLHDEIAERGGCWPDEGGVPADTADGPVGVTAMAGWHVVGGSGVLAVATRSHVHGNALALDEDLHGAAGEPHLDLAAREAVGNAVEMPLDIDMVIDADTAHAPFGEHIRLGRQRLERRPVELFEQLPARDAEPADRSLLVEPLEQIADLRIQLGEAVEPAIAQTTDQPAFDDQHAGFDFWLIAWPAWPGRQHGGAVVRCHLGIGSVDLRLVQAGLDDGDFGVVGNDETRHSANCRKGARVCSDPIAKRLRPDRFDVGEVGRAHDRDEDLRLVHLTGQPVDDHRHGVAGVIDEQLVATHMDLAHRDRELVFPASEELAEAGVAVALRIARDVLVPEDRQRDVLALQLPMDARPIGLDLPTVTLLRAGISEQPGLERRIGHLLGQRPAQAGGVEALDRRPHRRRSHANSTGNLTDRYATNELQPKNFAHLAHGRSLCWHPLPPLDSQRSGPESASTGTRPPGEIIPEWW